MTLQEISTILQKRSNPVILLEGKRDLPEQDREKLVALAAYLAEKFPLAIFRTGNAAGSDEAFASGVASIDPSRLEYILPYAGHRRKSLAGGSRQICLADVPEAEREAVDASLHASPNYASLLRAGKVVPRLRAKANYILRDTLKVIGAPAHGFHPATLGIFYVNPDKPMSGGTGHTIRVCRQHDVPVILQEIWMTWTD